MFRFLFAPKWLAFHLLVIVTVIAMINLGFWQLRRLDDRQVFNATVEARFDDALRPLDDVFGSGVDPDDVEWRPVTASGVYLLEEQILIVNRSQNGRAGDNVVVPMRLDGGRVLLVNRGFVPLAFEFPDPPTGTVDIVGRLRVSQVRRLGQLSDPAEGDLSQAQRIEIDRLAPQLGDDVVGMYVDLIGSDPADSSPLPEPVILPDLSEGSHLSYAFQWFIFSIAVAVGWVLAVRRSIRTHRHSHQPAPT